MKTNILDINGKKTKTIDLPSCFSADLREDIVSKVLEIKKRMQPYSPSPVAGKQHSASGIIVHRRKVWKSGYGRGISRIPRKIMSRKGSQFNWVGAEVSNTRGGRRPHPPKILSMLNFGKINKKEIKIALYSAISATANSKELSKKYSRLKDKKIENLPFVVENKFSSLKIKNLLLSVEKIVGKDLFEIATRKRSVRSGIGKLRGRKYKRNAGLLIVTGNKDKLKTSALDISKVKDLGINDLARGGQGRLVVYTESAIKDLGEKLK